MKSLQLSVETALTTYLEGKWDTIGGKAVQYGLEEGDFVGLPTAESSWNFKTFTAAEYDELLGKLKSGEIKVDNNSDPATKPTISEHTAVEYID